MKQRTKKRARMENSPEMQRAQASAGMKRVVIIKSKSAGRNKKGGNDKEQKRWQG